MYDIVVRFHQFDLFFDGIVIPDKFCIGVSVKHPSYLSLSIGFHELGANQMSPQFAQGGPGVATIGGGPLGAGPPGPPAMASIPPQPTRPPAPPQGIMN